MQRRLFFWIGSEANRYKAESVEIEHSFDKDFKAVTIRATLPHPSGKRPGDKAALYRLNRLIAAGEGPRQDPSSGPASARRMVVGIGSESTEGFADDLFVGRLRNWPEFKRDGDRWRVSVSLSIARRSQTVTPDMPDDPPAEEGAGEA